MSESKPPMQRRHSLTRKVEEEESEEVAKPTLGRSGSGSKMASRSDRIVASLQALSDERLQRLTTRIGADELAVALLDADPQIKARIAGCLQGESADMFNQYLSMGKEKLPSSVIDEVQGKLLRLAMMS